jgi:molybdate transport system ATP-binding protein
MPLVAGAVLEVAVVKRLAQFDLNIEFQLANEVLALFGPSGAGKSMTLKLIAGIERPDLGVVRAGERTLFDSTAGIDVPPQQRRVGYVPQHYALFPHLTALENVVYPLRKGLRWPAARAAARARELLELVGLADRAGTHPRELSGGQQQRVALARALAAEPEILLLDEPFAALDAPVRAELRQQFRALQQQLRIPALFVTHDLEEAAALSNRLAVIIEGRVRQIDTTRSVLDRPADRDVAALVQARNILRGTLHRTDGGALVDTLAGELRIGPTLLEDGALVDVIIRPDAVRVVRDDRPLDRLRGGVLLCGHVIEVVDHGTRAVVYIAVGDARLEAGFSPSTARRLDLAPGTAVRLAIALSDLHVVPARRP